MTLGGPPAGGGAVGALLRLLCEDPTSAADAAAEKQRLDDFLLQNAQRYSFASSEHRELLRLLAERRFLSRERWAALQPDHELRVLQAMRVLLRDERNRAAFAELGGVDALCEVFSSAMDAHFGDESDGGYVSEMLVEILSIVKRFADSDHALPAALYETLALLLRSRDALVLQCALVAACQLAKLASHRAALARLECGEVLLRTLADGEPAFKTLAAEILERLVLEPAFARALVGGCEGLPVLLSQLHADESRLSLSLLRALETLAADEESQRELRQLGGLHVVLSLLAPAVQALQSGGALSAPPPSAAQGAPPPPVSRELSADVRVGAGAGVMAGAAECGPRAASHPPTSTTTPRATLQPAYLVAVCQLLGRLAVDNENAHALRKANAVFLLGQLLLPAAGEAGGVGEGGGADAPAGAPAHPAAGAAAAAGARAGGSSDALSVRTAALCALRCLFSTERNRRIFKRLFPPDIFAAFIDIGHYEHGLGAYVPLVRALSALPAEAHARVREALDDINVVKGPARRSVRGYALQELLGRGAFGCVFHGVKGGAGGGEYAVKQLPLTMAADGSSTADAGGGGGGGGGGDDSEAAAARVRREVAILSGLHHPHIIRYYESFSEAESLYIVTELVDGATLLDHLTALQEKRQRLPEPRVWQIFVQLLLALRYCHKEAGVVHRDLTPSNIMLTADGTVKLADFGLARARASADGREQLLESVVGTVLYQSPELIKHEAYSDKADVWALGCVLYQCAMLEPPFSGTNPLVVAQRIVDGAYPPLDGACSPMLHDAVARCLTVREEDRPDADGVGQLVAPKLLAELDRLNAAQSALSAELATERERRVEREREAARNKEAMHRLIARSATTDRPAGGGGGSRGSSPASARPPAAEACLAPAPTCAGASGAGGGGARPGAVPAAEAAMPASARGSDGGAPAVNGAAAAAGGGGGGGGAERPPPPAGLALQRLQRLSSAEGSALLDSGGQPSPLRRLNSGASVPAGRSQMLSISPHRIREINDPASLLLNQLHKVLFIEQLPPSLHAHAERAIVERYKRSLFAHRPGARPRALKDELHKLMSGSRELVDLSLASGLPARATAELGASGASGGQHHVSYESLQQMIEKVLADTGYYDVTTTPVEGDGSEGGGPPAVGTSTSMPDGLSANATNARAGRISMANGASSPLGAVVPPSRMSSLPPGYAVKRNTPRRLVRPWE